MEVKEVANKFQWENFILGQRPDTFLQSWNWGEFNQKMGDKVFRLGIFNGEELAGAALIIKVSAKRGKFLFCPHGPIISQKSKVKSQKLLEAVFDF